AVCKSAWRAHLSRMTDRLGRSLKLAISALGLCAYHARAQGSLVGRLPIPDSTIHVGSGAISPDGSLFAFDAIFGREHAVWIYRLAGGPINQYARFDGVPLQLAWAPDGSAIAYWQLERHAPLELPHPDGLYVLDLAERRTRRIDTLPEAFVWPT